jgi:hypothetical protein
VGESQLNDVMENFVAIPLIILIGIFMIATSVAPFLNLNSLTFKVVFTTSAGIPSLALFYMQKLNKKHSKLKQTSQEKPR